MNTFKLQRTSEIRNKDFYVHFEYPIGAKVIAFTKGAVTEPNQCRIEAALLLMDHFTVAERKERIKPSVQTYVDNINTIDKGRQWLHDRKVSNPEVCMNKLKSKVLPSLESILDEYDLIHGASDDMIAIVSCFRDTVENK